ncbi:MAG: hypothetical protein ACJA1Z_001250 [Patiriisocius sp.]|jgi:hypothetical protein
MVKKPIYALSTSPSLSKTAFILPLRVLAVFQPLVCVSWIMDHKKRSVFKNIGTL